MMLVGRVRNGVVVFDQSVKVPEGAVAQVELLASERGGSVPQPRQGGQWKGKVVIANDFDVLPDEIRLAFGMSDS